MRIEVLIDPQMFAKGTRMLDAMIAAAPEPVDVRTAWSGNPCVLMVYGTGHPVRRPQQLANLRAGGRLIGWDLGYWHRDGDDFHMRLTLDADHPQKWIRPEPPDRWDRAGIPLRDEFRKHGPIIIVGMGPKSYRAFELGQRNAWELKAARAAKLAYPDRQVIYRPKRRIDPPLPGFQRALGKIENVLHGASLVVCRHSNVAIDACIAGVPVVCEDGAAAALYGSKIAAPVRPSTSERLEFLRSLAWWQWKPEEAAQAWTYLESRLYA